MVKNIMIVGVGGQGALLASKTLGQVLLDAGYDVKVSEVHGMSQRGGSVVTYVRYGDKVYSPIVDKGEADFIVSFELLEAEEPSLIISRRPCALLKEVKHKPPLKVDQAKCKSCKMCMKIGCPAIAMKDGKAKIDVTLCVGCGVCSQMCKFDALKAE